MPINILSRAQWGSSWPSQGAGTIGASARSGVIIHHSVTGEGTDQNSVVAILRAIERLDRDSNKWPSSYNFAVDHAGIVYELTGLSRIGTHAANNNSANWGICYIGDGRSHFPDAAAQAIREVIYWLSRQSGHQLQVRGHQQVNNTACPGGLIQGKINTGYFSQAMQSPTNGLLAIDGVLGPATIAALQLQLARLGYYQGPPDGVIDAGTSATVAALQRFLNDHGAEPHLAVDGAGLWQRPQSSQTNAALQRRLGTPVDGRFDLPASVGIRALQVRLNAGSL